MTHARRTRVSLLAALWMLLLLAPSSAFAKLKVVATLGDHAAMVREVGGEHVDVTLLAQPSEDPHFVDPKPSYVARLAGADLLIFNGMGLEEGWLPTLVRGSRNAKIQQGQPGHLDLSKYVERMGGGKTSRSEGDVHPEGNPHYSLDPRQMARGAAALGVRLGQLDPEHADYFEARGLAFARKALALATRWEKKFAALPAKRRVIVTYHEAWDYVIDWLSLERPIAIEPKPGVPPNPRHVAKVLGVMKERNVPVILRLEYYPSATADIVAERAGARVIAVEGHARTDATYFERVEKYVGALYGALGGA